MKRAYEILPGALAWATIILMFVLSWRLPIWVSIFIILFDIYWLLKTIYLSLHLRATFNEMKKNLAIDWMSKLEEAPSGDAAFGRTRLSREPERGISAGRWQDIYHLVILPMFDEPYEVVRESFERLAAAHYPHEKLFVVLGTEERAGDAARETGEKIAREFSGKFGRFMVTRHPGNLPGEIPGKGSNESWAGMQAKSALLDPLFKEGSSAMGAAALKPENVLVSVFDIDTQVFPEYFGRLTYVFLHAPNRLRAIYQPIPLFVNNIYEAPALARVVAFSTTFWQMMQQSRPERLTSFSSQAVPLSVLLDIGFWQRDIVSEDSRIFWQGYLQYHGEFRVEPLFYPLSMDANVATTFWGTMKNLYKQQRRWGWGCENIPYMLEGFDRDPSIPAPKKRYWRFNVIEGFHSWATNSLMIFALGWLPLLLGGHNFNSTLLSYSLPHITRFVIDLSMIGIVSSAILSVLLLPPRPAGLRRHWYDYAVYFLQWVLMPITLILFGAFPGLDSQTRLMLGGRARLGFWVTPKGRRGAATAQA